MIHVYTVLISGNKSYVTNCQVTHFLVMIHRVLMTCIFCFSGQWPLRGGGNAGGGGQQGGDVLGEQTAPAQLPSIRTQQQQQAQGFPQQQAQGFPQAFQGIPQQTNLGNPALGERGQMLLLSNGAASILIANRDRLPRDRVRRVGVPVSLVRAFAIQPEVLLPRSLTASVSASDPRVPGSQGKFAFILLHFVIIVA